MNMPSTNLLSNLYVQDILAQPSALRNTLAALHEPDCLPGLVDDLARGNLQRVVLTGMGASYHALVPLWLRLSRAGLPTHLVETSELIYYFPALLAPDSLLIVVSQSGSSAEITHLLNSVDRQSPVLGITNTPESPLAQASNGVILTSAGHEATVSCKTYITSLAALIWLGEKMVDSGQEAAQSWLLQAAESTQNYLAHLEAHVASLVEMLVGTVYLTFVGRGSSLAAVGAGALIVREAAHFPADGMGSAAFRHGPLEAVSPEQLIMVYAGPSHTGHLNEALYRDILAIGGRAALIGATAALEVLTLPAAPPEAQPIIEILPAQMISIALAQMTGHTAGRFQFVPKVVTTE